MDEGFRKIGFCTGLHSKSQNPILKVALGMGKKVTVMQLSRTLLILNEDCFYHVHATLQGKIFSQQLTTGP
jgi:hypothetical protein